MTQTNETATSSPPLAVLERKLKGHSRWVKSVAVSPDGKWAVSGSKDQTIKTWDLKSGQCRATLKGHKDEVNSVDITPDGTRILSGSWDMTIRVWDVQTGRHLTTLEGHNMAVLSVVALLDSRRVLAGAVGGGVKLWDLNTGNCIKTLTGHNTAVTSVAVTQDGKRAVSGSFDNTLKHWDLETGQCLATLKGHAGYIRSVQITPDGRRAVSGSLDKTVKLWDLEAGTCVGTFEGHQEDVDSVAISPDGTLAASTGAADSTIRIWDLKSLACLQVIQYEKDTFAPCSVAFSPDGSRLVVGNQTLEKGDKHSLYVYRLSDVKAARPVEAGERYTNAKVVLVGESGVGKSGLAHRLIDDKFIKTYSTHGMQVWRMDLPIEKEQGIEREALLWDLAGQEDYRLIHQLFLDETALALVLFNPQKEDPFAEVVDWTKVLNATTAVDDPKRDAVKLLIAARTDVGTVKVSQKKIDRFIKDHGFAAYLPTSARRGDNCSDRKNKNQPSALKQLVTRHIPWHTLPWTSAPKLLRELKNAVLSMTEEKDTGLLRFPELVQRLKQKLPDLVFDPADVRTAVTLLANHCLVMPSASSTSKAWTACPKRTKTCCCAPWCRPSWTNPCASPKTHPKENNWSSPPSTGANGPSPPTRRFSSPTPLPARPPRSIPPWWCGCGTAGSSITRNCGTARRNL
jgi:small GTP-binding protein